MPKNSPPNSPERPTPELDVAPDVVPEDEHATSDAIDEIVRTARSRLDELQPYLEEAARLEAVLAASKDHSEPSTGRRPPGSNKAAILAVIATHPGVTAAEISRTCGMKRTVVASTVSRLKRTGELLPQGRGVRLPGPGELPRT